MRRHALGVLFLVTAAACSSPYAKFREQDRAEFGRLDSSFVTRSVDALVQAGTHFRTLPQTGLRPREIVVSRGDSAGVYNALGVFVTFELPQAPDACVPPARATLLAWKELPSRAGVEAVMFSAAGDTAGMRDTFSIAPNECNGPTLTLHHPLLGVWRIIDRQHRPGAASTGKGTLFIDIRRPGERPCPEVVVTYLASQRFPATCRLTSMQVLINTRIRSWREPAVSDTFIVQARIPALHIWMDCRSKLRAIYHCPPLQPVPEPVIAQTPRPPAPPQMVTVTGVIKDQTEGVPIPYSRVRLENNTVVYADSNGRFTIQLKPGRATLTAECFGRFGGVYGRGQDPFLVRPYMAELALFVERGNCMRPPAEVRDSVFEGTWDVGLERSRFAFCGNRTLNVWAQATPQAEADQTDLLPRLRGQEGRGGFIWRVRGSLSGPGRYGLQSTADFQLTIERVLEIRLRGRSECYR